MSIFCMNCGKELPDDANFCLKCGKPVGSAVKPTPQPEPKWEYCEITWTRAGWLEGACYFWAKGIGPTGINQVAKSSTRFATATGGDPLVKDKKTQASLNEVVQTLLSSGWEPISERGPDWWSYKFRRKVS